MQVSASGTGKRLVGEEVLNVSELVVDHESKKSHLGGTSLVQFNGTLGELGLFIEGVPSEVKGSVTEVTDVLISGSLDVLHDSEFQETDKGGNLKGSGDGDGEGRIPSVSKAGEGCSGVVNVTWKVDSGGVDKVSNNSKHADTSVLDFNVTKTVELVLVAIGNKSQRIEESKGSLGTELVLEGHVGGDRGTGSILGRSKGSSRGDEGGKDSRLHFDVCFVNSSIKKNCEDQSGCRKREETRSNRANEGLQLLGPESLRYPAILPVGRSAVERQRRPANKATSMAFVRLVEPAFNLTRQSPKILSLYDSIRGHSPRRHPLDSAVLSTAHIG